MVPHAKRNLQCVWELSDDIFHRRVTRKRAFERPIPYRHPYIFYLGHLPAFAWRQIRHANPHLPHINAQYEALFERGIDPVIDAHSPDNVNASNSTITTWPPWDTVLNFRDTVRARILQLLDPAVVVISNRTLSIIIEHDAMHNETLAYMLAQSMREIPAPINGHVDVDVDVDMDLADEWCYIPGDKVSLGTDIDHDVSFVWDNEIGAESHDVKSFHVRKYPVTNGEFANFIRADAYKEEMYWEKADWAWVENHGVASPASFRMHNDNSNTSWAILTPYGYVNLAAAADWPAFVSLAEAKAYTKWANNHSRLPTEAEWNLYSRGTVLPTRSVSGYPHAVTRGSRSDLGAVDCAGNGWEWTASLFAPFEGFEAMPEYREYSADFFDSAHHVLKGASYATWGGMARRSFRNFFQARYPYLFAQFRLVKTPAKGTSNPSLLSVPAEPHFHSASRRPNER